MKNWFAAMMLPCVITAQANGQEPQRERRYEIRGTVFDSVAGVPLAGTRVEVAARNSAGAPHVVFSDASGHFSVTALPAGSFLVGFYHDNLTALGLDSPVATVELGDDSVRTVTLSIPSAPVVRALRCGGHGPDVGGMLVGFIRDAEDPLAVPKAVLRLSWRAFALDSGDYRTVVERETGVVSPDGSFLACRLPLDATLELELTAPGRRPIVGSVVVIPSNGLARVDFALVDTGRFEGASRVRGRVFRPNGKVVATGRAVIPALSRDVPIRDGEFLLNDIPQGSWVIEAREIGSEPQMKLISARDSALTAVEMRIGESLQRLEAITVVGKRDASTRLLEEVLRRKRIGMGTVFLPNSVALKSATFTSDVMKEARGFLYQGRDRISARISLSTRGVRRCTNIAVFVDEMLQPYGFQGLDAIVPPSQVLALEAYPDILSAPVQYRTAKTELTSYGSGRANMYCAVVLVWTKNRPRW